MTELDALRSWGHDRLAQLLRERPELLEPRPPISLRELRGRLRHPAVTLAALRRLDLPTLQVLQVLCALRGRAGRAEALALLGAEPGSDRAEAVDRAVETLRARGLIGDTSGTASMDVRPAPVVADLWPLPLGLATDVETLAAQRPVEALRPVLGLLGRPEAGRKPELVARLVETLRDGAFVRRLVHDSTPPEFADRLTDVAFGRAALDRYSYGAPTWHGTRGPAARADDPRQRPLDWAMARFLLVPRPEGYGLMMPAEVALALRGEGWTAAFSPDPPPLAWTPRRADSVADGALAAASCAVRGMDAVLSVASRRPLTALKAGGIGTRELRRLAVETGLTTGEAKVCLELAHHLHLLDLDEPGYAPTPAFDGWRRRPVADRYAAMLRSWTELAVSPALAADAAWDPRARVNRSRAARQAVLAVLGDHPGQAPASVPDLEEQLRWHLPLLTSTTMHSDTGDDAGAAAEDAEQHRRLIRAVLTEAAWLGVTAADALSPAGTALATGGDVRATVSDHLAAVRTSARLQADLTATVLGEPDAELATTLDLAADREGRSTASVWRFSPATVRRALDAGHGADDLLALLTNLADGGVPQPLEYLIRDVARTHGAARGRAVACYLRSDDEALLSEIVADRRLRALGLRRIAPTAVVGSRPWPNTVEALRAAGYAPVEEDADGGTVAAVVPEHRALGPDDGFHPVAPPGTDRGFAADGDTDAGPPDPDALADALLTAENTPGGMLLDTGTTILEIRDRADLFSFAR
ncbi:MAG TPA: helicase-associated domain-containing protein [Kineosporiaceae bacterium]